MPEDSRARVGKPGRVRFGVVDPSDHARIERGRCVVLFAYDAGFRIDLDRAEALASGPARREGIRHGRRTPTSFEYRPAPLRLTSAIDPVAAGRWRTEASIETIVFDFGALSIAYAIDIEGPLDSLLELSAALYENQALLADSRARAESVLRAIRPAVARPGIHPLVEDYAVYVIERCEPGPEGLIAGRAHTLARILRSEPGVLSEEQVADALELRTSYGPGDAVIADWNAALVLGPEPEEAVGVLGFANVELLEMRYLDDRLDDLLDRAYRASSGRRRRSAELGELAALQIDSAILFEGVNNALKLLGDQHLARVYRRAAQRFHLPAWDASILRKLQTADGIYQKLSDRRANRRMELLEWIIIALIAFEVVMALLDRARG